MRKVRIELAALAMFIAVMCSANVFGQTSVQHLAPTIIQGGEEFNLEFLVPGIDPQQVQEALLFYRTDGDISYAQKEGIIRNDVVVFTHQIDDVAASLFEYYFVIQLVNGQQFTFPENNVRENPVQVTIAQSGEEEVTYEELTGVEYNILAPVEGSAYTEDDFVVAIALFYDPDLIDDGEFRLFIDGNDVTSEADTSSHFISYAPEKIRMGNHQIALDYITNEGERLRLVGWNFNIIDPSNQDYSVFGEAVIPEGSVELTARNQTIGGDVNDAFTGRVRLSGQQGYFNYSVNGFLTSQESNRLQPQNRFGVNMNYGKWLRLDAGHIFPSVSNLTMAGRRVFGVNSSVHLANEKINIQFLAGELNRDVRNQYGQLVSREVLAQDGSVVDTTYSLNFANNGQGTFTREIVGGRVAFGNERKFQFGIHAIKVQDDTSSIERITDFTSLQAFRNDLATGLSAADVAKLSNQPDLLLVNGNPTPNGNFVAGTDLKFSADKRRIQFQGEVSAGVLNNDISGGALTVQRADDLGFEISGSDEDLLSDLSRFIIINENMRNLPLRIDDGDTDFFFPTAILAGNTLSTFNYGFNNLRIQYRWIGPDYNSLANNTIRKDIAGFTITDRVRLLENRLFWTFGYEALQDNVVGNLDATTQTNTITNNVSWFPIDRSLPRVSVGIRVRNRDNDVGRFNPNLAANLLNSAVQNFEIVNGDTLGAPVSRSNSTFNFNSSISQQFDLLGITHNASLNINTLNTTDDFYDFGDTRSTSFSLNMNSQFLLIPLRTTFGLSVNNTETTSGLSEFKIFGLYAGGTYFLMENKLRISGRLATTSNRTSVIPLVVNDNGTATLVDDFFEAGNPINTVDSDFNTFVFRSSAQYDLDQNHSFLFEANFTNVSGATISNDRIVQLRYVFRF